MPPVERYSSFARPGHLVAAAAILFLASILLAPRTMVGGEAPKGTTEAVADLAAVQRAFQQIVAEVSPSVVGIRAVRIRSAPPGYTTTDGGDQHIVVNGSGLVYSADGLILTNEHVIQAAAEIEVLFHDGQRVRGMVLAADPRSDLAIVEVPRSGLHPATLCDWTQVTRGQWSIVLGNPFGLGSDGQLSVSIGVVANLGRQLPGLGEVDDRFYNDMIQTTAPINPGDSGGPLFNIKGELIGIVTAMHTRAPADEGIGFAIPLTPAKRRIIDTLAQGRPIEYGYLGVTARALDPDERELLGLTTNQGVVIQQIEPDGPAAAADLRLGDVIQALDGHRVTGPAQFAELVGQTAIGTTVRVEFSRGGHTQTVPATVARRELSRVSALRNAP